MRKNKTQNFMNVSINNNYIKQLTIFSVFDKIFVNLSKKAKTF